MRKLNKKGFVLTETLMVAVFLVTIFLFVYMSVIPLIGKYRDMSERENNIDIVYKLYHVRKMLIMDVNEDTITGNSVKNFTCNDLSDKDYCTRLMAQLDLTNYKLIYTNKLNSANIATIRSINSEIADYASKYTTNFQNTKTLLLIDTKNHTMAHMKYKN